MIVWNLIDGIWEAAYVIPEGFILSGPQLDYYRPVCENTLALATR